MKKVYEESDCYIWEDENGMRLVAVRAYTQKGIYWTVDYGKPKQWEKLGTRCTWEQVQSFLKEKSK